MKSSKLLQALSTVLGIYLAFKIIFGGKILGVLALPSILNHPIPESLLSMYMFFVIVGTLMVLTVTEDSSRELVAPIIALVVDPSKKNIRNIVFIVTPLLAGFVVYQEILPQFNSPAELRTIHPSPPSSIRAFGKHYDLVVLENPYRKLEKKSPKKYKELVKEGGQVYFSNCQQCHGAKLDGRGLYAAALNPYPSNFTDVGTIAQLQESYLFWRIVSGGSGLPADSAPWNSAMPAWEGFLTEDEIWKVILFLYDYTGYKPRSWGDMKHKKGRQQ